MRDGEGFELALLRKMAARKTHMQEALQAALWMRENGAVTTYKLAEVLDLPYHRAHTALCYLEGLGVAKRADKVRTGEGAGRSAIAFELRAFD